MDIVDRLRAEGADAMRRHYSLGMHTLCSEAADEIDRLRAAMKRAAGIIDVNIYHQREKVEDAKAILLQAINAGT